MFLYSNGQLSALLKWNQIMIDCNEYILQVVSY